MKLITESCDVQFITEKLKNGKKQHFIEGVFLQSEIKNRNGRIYPAAILEKEVDRYTNDYIKENRAVGELGHPEGPGINLDRVSHKIVSLVKEGNNYMGKALILDTTMGMEVQKLLEGGVQLGVSSRGMGTLKESSAYGGAKVVQDDFYLATGADIVADPSAPDAFVSGIMEGKEWIWSGGVILEKDLDKIRNDISKASSRQLEEVKVASFVAYMDGLMKG